MNPLMMWLTRHFKWRRQLASDLQCAENSVTVISKKLHLIAGRAHVLEMEAYGETRPRQTMPPSAGHS
jgi:hypothetical protein